MPDKFRGMLLRPEYLARSFASEKSFYSNILTQIIFFSFVLMDDTNRRGFFIDEFKAGKLHLEGSVVKIAHYRHLKFEDGRIVPWTVQKGKEHVSSYGERRQLEKNIEDWLSKEDKIAHNDTKLSVNIVGIIEGEIIVP